MSKNHQEENERLREEITEHRQAEEALRQTHIETKRQLESRTADLTRAHKELQKEIGDRKEAEKALWESEQRCRKLIDEVLIDGIIIHERGTIIEVNQVLERLLGTERAELIGGNALELMAPEYREVASSRMREGAREPYEALLMRKDGRTVPVEMRGGAIPYHGRKARVVVVRDLTKRKDAESGVLRIREDLELQVEKRTRQLVQANERLWVEILEREKATQALQEREQAYRRYFEGSWEPVVMIDLEGDPPGRIVYANRRTEETFGYASGEISGLHLTDLVVFQSTEDGVALIENLSKGRWVREETEFRRKDGTTLPAEMSGGLLKVGDRKYALGFGWDITDRKRQQQQLQNALEEKEVMLREIHHRVKNNLSLIISLLTLQSQYASAKSTEEVFEDLQTRIRSMALSHELLYRSQNLREINVAEYIGNLVDHLVVSSRVVRSQISLKKKIEDVCFGLSTAIPLGFLLTELITNCLKHAFPDGSAGSIEVSLRNVGDREFELIVADDGIGMPDGIDVENPFSLGIDLVHSFASQLKGEIEIGRRNGTEVKIRFEGGKNERTKSDR